jgi:cysteinyl-tRNA synthetase
MIGGVKETVAELVIKVGELCKELVTNTVQFQELRSYTKETLSEFKRLLERLSDKLDESEKDRVRREAELLSKINALEAKLNALSEQALHATAKEAAREVFERMVAEKNQGINFNKDDENQKNFLNSLTIINDSSKSNFSDRIEDIVSGVPRLLYLRLQ